MGYSLILFLAVCYYDKWRALFENKAMAFGFWVLAVFICWAVYYSLTWLHGEHFIWEFE